MDETHGAGNGKKQRLLESHATDVVCGNFQNGFVQHEYMLADGTYLKIRTEYMESYRPVRELELLRDRILDGEAGAEESARVLSKVIKRLNG